MDKVAVIIPTYNRPEILGECICRIEDLVIGAELSFYIGNDYHQEIEIAESTQKSKIAIFNEPTGSLGANLNRLILEAKKDGHDFLFQLDDDHHLMGLLDLAPHINTLKREKEIGWIRLMGVAAHRYEAFLEENYWIVKWNSPELYITSNRPHLKAMRFHDVNGIYPEGKKLGETEEAFCHQCKDKASNKQKVAIPLTYNDNLWDHVGDSWQGEGF